MSNIIPLRRISPSTLREGIEPQIVDGKPVWPDKAVASIACVIDSIDTKESRQTGKPYTCLSGEFLAVRHDGKQFVSSTLFLPDYYVELLQKNVKDFPCRLGLKLCVKPSNGTLGFEYYCESLGNPQSIRQELLSLIDETGNVPQLKTAEEPPKSPVEAKSARPAGNRPAKR
jgi:hypothetical protein